MVQLPEVISFISAGAVEFKERDPDDDEDV